MLRVEVDILQGGIKGVISESGDAFWSHVYVYILSMVKDCVRVVNAYGFFIRDTAPSMDRNYRGSTPQTIRTRSAIKR